MLVGPVSSQSNVLVLQVRNLQVIKLEFIMVVFVKAILIMADSSLIPSQWHC